MNRDFQNRKEDVGESGDGWRTFFLERPRAHIYLLTLIHRISFES